MRLHADGAASADRRRAANLVLQDTVERIFVPAPAALYADVQRGVFLVRGENVLMLGEIVRSPFAPDPTRSKSPYLSYSRHALLFL